MRNAVNWRADEHQSRGLDLYPVGLQADLVRPVRPVLLVLGAAGIFLLLVLTANLASLLFARVADREREFAVSRALGANSLAVGRVTLIEGALLGLIGTVLDIANRSSSGERPQAQNLEIKKLAAAQPYHPAV